MKKILSVILTGCMMLSCLTAQAAGRTYDVMTALSDETEIHILYNDTVVQYEDVKPVNTDGRVMIPFRAALENMGASVDYNDENRLVTAKKGDIEIKFTLMDDTIYIDKNGAQSTITMDVPMIIVSDRTLVPIRFMSNAFDMQVGWDGETETVIIIDYDDYSSKLKSSAPNLGKLAGLKTPGNIKSADNFAFSLNVDGTENDVDLSLSGKADNIQTADNISSDMTVSFSGFGIDVKDKKVSVIADGENGKIYFKADDKWYSVDISKLLTGLSLPAEFAEAFTASYSLGNDILNIGNLSKPEGDADIETAISLISALDAYEGMDKYISVTEKDNGGYECKVNLTNKDFMELIFGISGVSETELADELSKMFNVSMSADAVFDGTKGNSKVDMDISFSLEDVKLSLKMNIDETFEKDDSLKPAEAPGNSEDITDKLVSVLKTK